MYAQIVETQLSRERLSELGGAVRRELLPALRSEPGFCGALSLVERERGAVLLVVLWETKEAAGPHAWVAAALGETSSILTALLTSSSVRVWEVNARG